ncbi:uncharacterized protein LOC144104111 [Amblyomma americanum]
MATAAISSVCLLFVLRTAASVVPNRTENAKISDPQLDPLCRLLPFSGYRSKDGTLYALGTTKIWSRPPSPSKGDKGGGGGGSKNDDGVAVWRDSVLPQKLSGDAWRIVCASDRHVALYDGLHALLHAHRSSAWRNIPLGQAGNATPVPAAIWCTPDEVEMLNLKTGALTRFLGDGRINVTESSRLPVLPAKKSHTHTWYHQNQVYVISDRHHNGSALLNNTTVLWKVSGYSGFRNWKVASQWTQGAAGYPASLAKSYSWTGGDDLWLWRELGTECELWRFNVPTQTWIEVKNVHVSGHGQPLLAWSRKSDNLPCLLFADFACNLTPYTYCLTHEEVTGHTTQSPPAATKKTTSRIISQVTATESGNSTTTPRDVTSVGAITTPNATSSTTPDVLTTPTETTIVSTSSTSSSTSPATAATISVNKAIGGDSTYSVVDSDQSKWHQRNSGIFGSIIFFGTSITIFTIVGVVWCIRHCVHFPKEALLLRDPPSVRYTAIPDTIA